LAHGYPEIEDTKRLGGERGVTAVKVATLSYLAYSHFRFILHLEKHLAGQKFYEDEEVKKRSRHEVACAGGGVLCHRVGGWTRTQAKQMPAQSCLRRKIANGRCWKSSIHSLLFINIFLKLYCVHMFTSWTSYLIPERNLVLSNCYSKHYCLLYCEWNWSNVEGWSVLQK
jgi:hypothetical protein